MMGFQKGISYSRGLIFRFQPLNFRRVKIITHRKIIEELLVASKPPRIRRCRKCRFRRGGESGNVGFPLEHDHNMDEKNLKDVISIDSRDWWFKYIFCKLWGIWSVYIVSMEIFGNLKKMSTIHRELPPLIAPTPRPLLPPVDVSAGHSGVRWGNGTGEGNLCVWKVGICHRFGYIYV